jgi:hypothetical protein
MMRVSMAPFFLIRFGRDAPGDGRLLVTAAGPTVVSVRDGSSPMPERESP